MRGRGDRVTHFGLAHVLRAGDHIADLARAERARGHHVPADVLRVSGKTGEGVHELLDRIVVEVPAPTI